MNLASTSQIDFYVSVIDNYGDMGFAINLAASLRQKYPDLSIRFFTDDRALFQKFSREDTHEWLEYFPLDILTGPNPPDPARLIFNFFDYHFSKEYLGRFAYPKTLVSFSYFLLHEGLESLHGTTYVLESGLDTVIHFVPSLLLGGGGVIVNPDIEKRKNKLLNISKEEVRRYFLEKISMESKEDSSLRSKGQMIDLCGKKWVSVFVYNETMESILEGIAHTREDAIFFIFGNDIAYLAEKKLENIIWMSFLSLEDYGIFQSLCDANIVRGENSLCQGLISGKPVLWDIYKENNRAHLEKIDDYLAFLGKYFPDTNWEEYSRMMRMFNESEEEGSVFLAFLDFLFWQSGHKEIFENIAEYIIGESDLVRKLEEIGEK